MTVTDIGMSHTVQSVHFAVILYCANRIQSHLDCCQGCEW